VVGGLRFFFLVVAPNAMRLGAVSCPEARPPNPNEGSIAKEGTLAVKVARGELPAVTVPEDASADTLEAQAEALLQAAKEKRESEGSGEEQAK
jgi:hypothetical protein